MQFKLQRNQRNHLLQRCSQMSMMFLHLTFLSKRDHSERRSRDTRKTFPLTFHFSFISISFIYLVMFGFFFLWKSSAINMTICIMAREIYRKFNLSLGPLHVTAFSVTLYMEFVILSNFFYQVVVIIPIS